MVVATIILIGGYRFIYLHRTPIVYEDSLLTVEKSNDGPAIFFHGNAIIDFDIGGNDELRLHSRLGKEISAVYYLTANFVLCLFFF